MWNLFFCVLLIVGRFESLFGLLNVVDLCVFFYFLGYVGEIWFFKYLNNWLKCIGDYIFLVYNLKLNLIFIEWL